MDALEVEEIDDKTIHVHYAYMGALIQHTLDLCKGKSKMQIVDIFERMAKQMMSHEPECAASALEELKEQI